MSVRDIIYGVYLVFLICLILAGLAARRSIDQRLDEIERQARGEPQ